MRINLGKYNLNIRDFLISIILSIITCYSIFIKNYCKLGLFIFITFPFLLVLYNILIYTIKYNFSEKKMILKVKEIIITFLIATIITKSFIIYIYPINMGFKAIIYGFGWTLLTMSIIYCLKNLFLKLYWKNQKVSKNSFKMFILYCIPSLIIFGLMLAIYFPGIGSIDSISIWNSVQNNAFNDNHPLMFMLILKVLSLIWNNIAIVTIFQVLFCSLTFGYTVYYFHQKGLSKKWCFIIAVMLPLIPTNTIYSILLWKDIPYTMGLIIFTIMTIKSLEDNYLDRYSNLVKFALIGLLVLYTRHNALVPIFGTLGFLALYFLRYRYYRNTLKIIGLFIILAISFIGSKSFATSMLDDKCADSSVLPTTLPTTIQAQQIIYIEHYYGDDFSKDQKENFNKFFDAEKVEEHKFDYRMGNSYGPNWMFYHKPYITNKSNAIAINSNQFWNFYWDLVKEHPVTAFEGYQRITAISWASVGFGPTAFRGYSRDEFNIYVNTDYRVMMKPVIGWLDNTIFKIYGGLGIIFTRPAFYLMLILYFSFLGFRRHKYKMLLIVCPALLNALGYLIIIAAQDVRYFHINYTVAVIAFVYSIMFKNNKVEIENAN